MLADIGGHPRQRGGKAVEPGRGPSVLDWLRGTLVPELGFDERRQRGPALVRQLKAVERHREHMRRRRIEVEQQAKGVGQIDIGKVPQDRLTVQSAVEEAGQYRALQE